MVVSLIQLSGRRGHAPKAAGNLLPRRQDLGETVCQKRVNCKRAPRDYRQCSMLHAACSVRYADVLPTDALL